MADNVTITPGAGATVAADEIGGILWQRVKVTFGSDGSATDVDAANGLPVNIENASIPVTGTFWQATQPISAAALPLPAGAATSAKQDILSAQFPATLGQKAKANALAVTLASDEDILKANSKYATVAAAQTAQLLGNTGAAGDLLSHLLIVPATTSPGAVSIIDGTGTPITVFAGGTLSAVVPFPVPLNAKSTGGGWHVTTGANVSVVAVGSFT